MNRNDEDASGNCDSTFQVDTTDSEGASSRSSSGDCPPDGMLHAAVHGFADTLCLDTLAEHLSQCDSCVERIETLIREARITDGAIQDEAIQDGETHPVDAKFLDLGPDNFTLSGQRELLGRYRLGRVIGNGGMGNVYEAYDKTLGRTVAVKMLRVDTFSPEALDRFEREARAQASLNHPNIVSLYEFGHHQGIPFLVMEYVAGGPLSKVLRERPLPSRTSARLMVPIARAVAHAHQKGLLHRDLKPSNILIASTRGLDEGETHRSDRMTVNESDIPKVADFGLARILNDDSRTTRSDTLVGTVAYLAPERVSNTPCIAGPESDIYAVGVMLYECLTGRPPFQGEDTAKTLAMIRDLEPVPPSDLKPDIPRDLETICLKCLEKEPRHRYETADELADDLQRFLDDLPIRARPLGYFAKSLRWCLRNKGSATAIGVAIVSMAILSIGGWVAAGIQSDLKEKARLSAIEARRLAAIAEESRLAEKKRSEMALTQLINGTSALNRFGMILETPNASGSDRAKIEQLLAAYRTELVNLTDKFLAESEGIEQSPEIMAQVLSIGAASNARNGNLERAEELYRKLEETTSQIERTPNTGEKPLFFVLYAASVIAHEYRLAGRNHDAIRLLTDCLDRWKFDIRHPKTFFIVLGTRRNLLFALKLALETEGLPPGEEIAKEISEIDRIVARQQNKNP